MIARMVAELRRRNVFRVAGIYVVVGWLLLQVVIAIEAPLQLPAWTDTLIIVLLGVGLPVAIVLAWAFELTPEGIKAEHAVADGERITPQTGRTLDYTVLAGFVLVAAMIVSDRLGPEPPVVVDPAVAQPAAPHESPLPAPRTQAADTAWPAPPAASIAVLPFADLSPGNDQQYFSDGMSEEILNVLARIDGLKVASRTSAFQFRSTAEGIPAIARELGVRHVLEGSVRRSGDAIRVTAQLIDAQGDAHLWSDTFDATLNAENVFAIQDQIAAAIVAALHERLGPDIAEAAPASPVRTSQVEAYELFLKGRALFQARRNLGEADRLFEQALAIDPRFAEALAIRAAIHQFGGEYGAVLGDERAARRKGREFAAEALAIDADNSLAHAITALSHFYDRQEGLGTVDYPTIFAGYERALALDPGNANALNWLGITYAHVGNNAKAVEVHTRCVDIDPALAACRSNLAGELLGLGRREDAAAVVDAAIDAGALAVGPGQMILLAELQRRDAFLLLSLNVPALKGLRGFNALYTAMSQAGGDDRAIATEVRTLLEANKGSSRVYTLLSALGDYSRPPIVVMHWIPLMKPYRESPEFREYMRASGVLDYWREVGFPPQCRPLGGEDFACD